jgi:hypothetical protein
VQCTVTLVFTYRQSVTQTLLCREILNCPVSYPHLNKSSEGQRTGQPQSRGPGGEQFIKVDNCHNNNNNNTNKYN